MDTTKILYQYLLIISFSLFMAICMTFAKNKVIAENELSVRPKQKENVTLLIFTMVTFVIYTSFRTIERLPNGNYISGGGLDSLVYKDIFMGITGNFFDCLRNVEQEPLWLLWNYIVRLFTDKFEVFLITFFLLEFILQYRICKELMLRKYFTFSYLMIIVNLLLTSLCIMRATLCIFIIGNAMIDLKKKRPIKAFIIGVVATGIHYSSAIFFPSFFVYEIYKKVKQKTAFGYISLCCLMGMAGIIIGGGLRIFLQGTRYSVTNYGYAWGLMAFRVFMLFAIAKKFNQFSLNDKSLVIALSFYAANFLVFGLQIYMTMTYRMYLFANIAEVILLPEMIGIYKCSKKKNRFVDRLIYVALISLYVYQFVKFYTESVYTYGLLTYQNSLIGR